MPGNFIGPDGDIENLYISEYELIDRYVTTGTLWGWGINSVGQLGDNTLTSRSSPGAKHDKWQKLVIYCCLCEKYCRN